MIKLTDEERWEAHTVLDMCRDGYLYATADGYAVVDTGCAEADPSCKQIADRLVDANLMTRGRAEVVQLDDDNRTTAQLDITDAGKRLLDQLTTALGL
ncbi:hypothetical protein [Amycolatopsis sp. 195334CR]|uniref:hypothetical protein n=1 Tax=Amycolatopsis sp. 195334CR TaxID=2814588 RepID=UPI001A8E1DC7|nr:hypothetical protein [Amycolatopsis sp. 195334CR]MBN6039123.1 hypothetical protein [Amycolatopsis sp. 195334CR]